MSADPQQHKAGPLTIITRAEGDCRIFELIGAASLEAAVALSEHLLEAVEQAPRRLIIEMSRLTFICTTGLGALVSAHLKAQQRQAEVRLVAPQESVRSVLMVTRLDQVLRVYADVEQARQG